MLGRARAFLSHADDARAATHWPDKEREGTGMQEPGSRQTGGFAGNDQLFHRGIEFAGNDQLFPHRDTAKKLRGPYRAPTNAGGCGDVPG